MNKTQLFLAVLFFSLIFSVHAENNSSPTDEEIIVQGTEDVSNKANEDLNKKVVFTDAMEEDLYSVIKYEAGDHSEAEIEHAMGTGLLNADQWERAEKHFKKAVEIDPNLYKAWYSLGLIYIDSEKGMEYFRKAIEVKPDYSPAYYWIAYYYTRYGNFKESLPIWEDYLRVAKAETANGESIEEDRMRTAEAVVEQIKSGKPGEELKMIHIK